MSLPPPPPRVTEGANPLTAALDTASPSEFLRLLQSCDAQLFTGSHGLPSLYSPSTLEAATACTLAVAAALAHPRGRIIFSGCGTSGRLAHLLARLYNLSWARICREQQPPQQPPLQRFHYLLAGGDAALLVPAESIEDQQQAGAGDLGAWVVKEGVGASDPTVLIGISVGLSATFVASTLAAALRQGPAWSAVAMGFNALEAVKAVKVPGSAVSFYSVLALMQEQQQQQQLLLGQNTASAPPTRCCVLINPVVGEEAVAGSSRMKGGSVTLLLCAAMCETALQLHLEQAQAQGQAQHSQSTTALLLRRSFQQAQGSVETLYERSCPALEGILVSASSALCAPPPPPPVALQPLTPPFTPSAPTAGGRLIYLGRSHAGILGLVDASEATDTYGSRFNDVRAFMAGGWGAMSVVKGGATDDPIVPPELQRRSAAVAAAAAAAGVAGVERASPSLHSFSQHFLPTLGPLDCVVVLSLPDVDAEELEGEGAPTSSPSVVLQELQDLHTAAAAAAATGAQVHFVSISHPSPPPGSISSSSSPSSTLAQAASAAAASLRALCRSGLHLELGVKVSDQQLQPQVQRSQRSSCSLLALKLALNALTTGAFAAQGALLGNRMANMMLTNHKLLLRARVTVGALTGASEEESHKALLRSVYGIDTAASGLDRLAELVAEEKADGGAALRHVEAAALVDKVIPVALLLLLHEQARVGAGAAVAAVEPLSVSAARAALQVKPRVRDALAMLLGSTSTATVH